AIAMSLLLGACAGGGNRLGAMTDDGLREITFQSLEYLAMKPGVNLSVYNTVHLKPTSVDFASSWKPTQTGSRIAMSVADQDRLRQDMGEQFDRALRDAIDANPRLTIVDAPAPGALVLTPRLFDVKLTGTNNRSQPVETVSRNSSRVSLELELVDAGNSELLARIKDKRIGAATVGGPTSSTGTAVELDRIFSAWASFVGDGLLMFALKADNEKQ
ncbi:MAG: DUF3313 domain-containing protein, partial [Proteobacteria bacterium]|nr:DUF3313 domain-containing protein [Pseudomonadota bacterium]